MSLQQTIQSKITDSFNPLHLEVLNESHTHSVPAGSETHFKVVIVSAKFEGQGRVARHRLVNDLLAEELKIGVHALSLHLFTESEWALKGNKVQNSPPCLGGSK